MLPKTFTLENFVDVQGRINIIRYIANSVIYAGVTTALAVVVNSMAGYAYAFYEFKGKTGTFLMTLATMMVPFQVWFRYSLLYTRWECMTLIGDL